MRTQAEWKVDTHIFSATGPTRAATRSFISSAALLVKVMARISKGETPRSRDEVGDAVGEDPGLARPGAGHDEQRPVVVGDRLGLLRVEPGQQLVGPPVLPLGGGLGARHRRATLPALAGVTAFGPILGDTGG